MQKTLRELKIGTYDNIETATEDTTILTALTKFVDRRVSALPIIDTDGHLVDIYAKFDVIVSSKIYIVIKKIPKFIQIFDIKSFVEPCSGKDLQ